jgi:hypothetical protein
MVSRRKEGHGNMHFEMHRKAGGSDQLIRQLAGRDHAQCAARNL